jgi:hypothetical protein
MRLIVRAELEGVSLRRFHPRTPAGRDRSWEGEGRLQGPPSDTGPPTHPCHARRRQRGHRNCQGIGVQPWCCVQDPEWPHSQSIGVGTVYPQGHGGFAAAVSSRYSFNGSRARGPPHPPLWQITRSSQRLLASDNAASRKSKPTALPGCGQSPAGWTGGTPGCGSYAAPPPNSGVARRMRATGNGLAACSGVVYYGAAPGRE